MHKEKDILSLSDLHHIPQPFLREGFLLGVEGLPSDTVVSNLETWQLDDKDYTAGLYTLPLYIYHLAKAHRAGKISLESLLPLWPLLATQLERLIELREDADSGLPFLIDYRESPLPKASYWEMLEAKDKVLEPAFIAIVMVALEAMLYLGEQLEKDTSTVLQASEMIAFGFNEALWEEEYGIYFPKEVGSDDFIVSNSIGGILPLLADLPTQEQAEAIYKALSLNFVHGQFGYFPSECVETGKEERIIDPLANYLLLDGLSRFEFTATAKALQKQIIDLHKQFGPLNAYPAQKVNPVLSGAETSETWVAGMVEMVKNDNLVHFSNLD